MSSYVIDKRSYARAAGMIAGFCDCKRAGLPVIYLWDYSRGRRYTGDDFKPAFDWLYHLNAKSVQLQYGDKEPENDTNSYNDDFLEYRLIGRKLYMFHGDKVQDAVAQLRDFFGSMLYQTEDEECERNMKGFIYRLYFELAKLPRRDSEARSWGSFEWEK